MGTFLQLINNKHFFVIVWLIALFTAGFIGGYKYRDYQEVKKENKEIVEQVESDKKVNTDIQVTTKNSETKIDILRKQKDNVVTEVKDFDTQTDHIKKEQLDYINHGKK